MKPYTLNDLEHDMKALRLPPIQVAKRAGLGRGAIYDWLNGHRQPKPCSLERARVAVERMGLEAEDRLQTVRAFGMRN